MNTEYYSAIPRSSLSFIIKDLKEKLLVITENEQEADLLLDQLHALLPEKKIFLFPAWDTTPYDRSSPHVCILAQRIEVLANINESDIIVTYPEAIIQKTLSSNVLKEFTKHIKINDNLERDNFTKFLITIGYNRASIASEIGDFAVRGSIIDIIVSETQGIRIDFFGNQIDSIKIFDPLSQITNETIDNLYLKPINEVILEENYLNNFRSNYRKLSNGLTKSDPLYEAVSNGQKFPGMEHFLPLFYNNELANLTDYCKNFTIIKFQEDNKVYESFHKNIDENYELRLRFLKKDETPFYPIKKNLLWQDIDEFENQLNRFNQIILSSFETSKSDLKSFQLINYSDFKVPTNYNSFEYIKHYRKQQNIKIIVACESEGSLEKMHDLLLTHELHSFKLNSFIETTKLSSKNIGLLKLSLETGFKYDSILIISEQDLLGFKIKRKKKTISSVKAENFIKEAGNLIEGELVVHKDYGIGRFMNLETLSIQSVDHDCLKILYAGNDKFYLPVENIDILSRYGPDDGVELDKLGHTAWQARTAKLKNRIKLQAEAILKIAAERALKTAPHLVPPAGLYDEFCARFPYVETDDQLRAIEEIINDLNSGMPMDRLVCGDVGFGKTEVAMRAAFVSVFGAGDANGARQQVAVIVPTTLLARQHFHNFQTRFHDMPVRIKMLSRLVSAKEAAQVKKEIENGSVDIIIGTHSLLGSGIKFQNLGLLIIDEEQHFGVKQKEKLKELKANIHVLTLTATPIPRTLHMALSGLRELSIIATPPVDRLTVKTFITPYDAVTIREAIINEKSRGGRTFYVCPRISDLNEVHEKLKELVPEAKIAVAHGQMPATQLEDIMNGFYDGKFDVLLSTTIVESGLDVQSANTMIIHRADMFGLSQLYQLRGRVGRGKIRAFAYLTIPKNHMITPTAKKRLEVMQKLDSLGAGFNVASHDMDIRGMGNLLGDEQSGHIREVGVELYQEMLKEAILELKDTKEVVSEKYSPQINIGLSVLIPDNYIEDINLRLGLYRRIASIENEQELNSFYAEMVDRFGPMPDSVKHLFLIIELKQLCLKACIDKIDTGPKGVVFSFYKNTPKNADKLMQFLAKDPNNSKLRPDGKMVLMREFKDDQQKISVIKNFINAIA
ncbi:MAG: transcription-repair coupling factor [Sphingobacteriia bacterium]|nr:transcription-repair coupling factor [Sphingobacteriia bacterium]